MEKPFKPSVLKKELGRSNRHIFRRNDTTIPLKKSLWQVYQNAAYRINRDFDLISSKKILDIGINLVMNETIIVEEFPTELLGMCYSIIQKPQMGQHLNRIFFGIVPKKSILTLDEDHPRGVTIFVTTEKTRKEGRHLLHGHGARSVFGIRRNEAV